MPTRPNDDVIKRLALAFPKLDNDDESAAHWSALRSLENLVNEEVVTHPYHAYSPKGKEAVALSFNPVPATLDLSSFVDMFSVDADLIEKLEALDFSAVFGSSGESYNYDGNDGTSYFLTLAFTDNKEAGSLYKIDFRNKREPIAISDIVVECQTNLSPSELKGELHEFAASYAADVLNGDFEASLAPLNWAEQIDMKAVSQRSLHYVGTSLMPFFKSLATSEILEPMFVLDEMIRSVDCHVDLDDERNTVLTFDTGDRRQTISYKEVLASPFDAIVDHGHNEKNVHFMRQIPQIFLYFEQQAMTTGNTILHYDNTLEPTKGLSHDRP